MSGLPSIRASPVHGVFECRAHASRLFSDVLDQAFLSSFKDGSPSLLPHIILDDPSTHPVRVLDLGCGTGAWVIFAASRLPNTEFVGYDLVNHQVALAYLDEDVSDRAGDAGSPDASLVDSLSSQKATAVKRHLSDRIHWAHGNFLLEPLPFEAAEFDHVRVCGIAKGVPENKVGSVCCGFHHSTDSRPSSGIRYCQKFGVFSLLEVILK